MSLSTAFNIAGRSLRATSYQTQIVSRNVSEAGNPNYNRRIAVLTSTAPGAQVLTVQRAANSSLFRANLSAISSYEAQASLRVGIESITQAVNGVDNASSVATAAGSLYDALQIYSANPSNASIAERAIDAARQVVRSLNSGSAAINASRVDADKQLQGAVGELNQMLAEFKVANDDVISGTIAGRNVSDSLDKRDALLQRIAEYVPVSTIGRANNDMVITTTSGTTLFETQPRAVTFDPATAYTAGSSGNQVYVDGVPLPIGAGGDTNSSGKLAGLIQLRDQVAPMLQAQLDEVARGMIEAFAEIDQSGGGGPRLAGLFSWSGGPALPTAGTLSNGLAARIIINPAMDSTVGGNASVLRDGGANGANYVANTGGGASYADLLISFQTRLDQPLAFDPAAGAGASASVLSYSTNSISWLESVRKKADEAQNAKEALVMRTSEALSNDTGVNMDQEMSLLLELEQSYQASSRIIQAVDEMFAALLQAAG
jgi:flagellar hook-associated protein 1 FlgK